MARFKLLVSQHQGPDMRYPADPVTKKRPTRTYVVGDVIESEEDLETRDPGKFKLISGRPSKPVKAPDTRSVAFPGGQVHDGLQQTTSLKDGTTVESPLTDDELNQLTDGEAPSDDNEGFIDLKNYKGEGEREDDEDAAAREAGRDYDREYGGLDSKTVEQLKEIAAAEEVELHGLRSKADIVAAIRKHGGA